MSFLIYSALFFSFFGVTGHRQTLATAFSVFIGYEFIKQRRFWPFLLCIAIAFPLHRSVLLLLPFYFLANVKITNWYVYSVAAFFPIAFIYRERIFDLAGGLLGYGEYGTFEGAGAYNFTLLLVMVTIVMIWKKDIIIANNPQAVHFINALIITLLLVPSTFVNPSAMRTVQYFSIFLLLLVPEILNTFEGREKVFAYFVSAGILIGLFIRNAPPYLFFWQGG